MSVLVPAAAAAASAGVFGAGEYCGNAAQKPLAVTPALCAGALFLLARGWRSVSVRAWMGNPDLFASLATSVKPAAAPAV